MWWGKESDSVWCVGMFGVDVVDGVAAVVFHGRPHIPAFVPVDGPRASLVGLVMCYHFNAWRGKGSGCEVKSAVQVFMC